MDRRWKKKIENLPSSMHYLVFTVFGFEVSSFKIAEKRDADSLQKYEENQLLILYFVCVILNSYIISVGKFLALTDIFTLSIIFWET